MPDHHVKGQPSTSTYVREKGGVKIALDPWTPCSSSFTLDSSISQFVGVFAQVLVYLSKSYQMALLRK